MRVLLVEDDKQLSKTLTKVLERKNYVVDNAYDGIRGETKATEQDYDVMVLDLGLPDKDGLEVCKNIRANGKDLPILMLTGRSTPLDKVSGLDAGADDYLPKPFDNEELLARLRAILRCPKQTIDDILTVGDLQLDVIRNTVRRDTLNIDLMPKEFALLEYLMRKPEEVATKEELLQDVWGIYSRNSSNRLEVYIRYVREKVDDPFDIKLIKTIRGKGYKISAQ